jgi:hypothetical protein
MSNNESVPPRGSGWIVGMEVDYAKGSTRYREVVLTGRRQAEAYRTCALAADEAH